MSERTRSVDKLHERSADDGGETGARPRHPPTLAITNSLPSENTDARPPGGGNCEAGPTARTASLSGGVLRSWTAHETARPIRSRLRTCAMRAAACSNSRLDSSSLNMPQVSARPTIAMSRGSGISSLNSTDMIRSFTSRSAFPSMVG